jgi:hypothetical protein
VKLTWEPDDVKFGRKVQKPGTSEIWIIGYPAGTNAREPRYSFVSLSDGMIGAPYHKDDFAKALTAGGYFPVEWINKTEAASLAE